jgi:general L-amino acid transport system permease protein
VLRAGLQIAFVAAVIWLGWYLFTNLLINLRNAGMRTDFDFLSQSAGFAISGSGFRSIEPIWAAILVGLRNTIVVSAVGIVLATILGVIVGVARLSTNWLVRKSAAAFVEALRNIPLLVLLVFLYIAVLQQLPRVTEAVVAPGFVLSNRGLWVPWLDLAPESGAFLAALTVGAVLAAAAWVWRTRRFDATGQPHRRVLWTTGVFLAVAAVAWLALDRPVTLTVPVLEGRRVDGGYVLSPEHGALLFGLVLYTAAFMAEIVRGSILAVPRGQTEAADAVGLTAFQRLRHVILPQALSTAIPPTGNEFLNLTKNSSLGIVIAFPELLRVTRIAIGNGYPAPQLIGIMMGIYLGLSLFLAAITNVLNRRFALRGS